MLDGSDINTFLAARRLQDALQAQRKPLVIWAGSGISNWIGYPLWQQFAEQVHSTYLKTISGYDRKLASALIQAQDFPRFFDLAFSVNQTTFKRILFSTFAPRPITPVYKRAIELLRQIAPLCIITTNVDEALERNIPDIRSVQRSHIEATVDMLCSRESFICKLHGTVGSADSPIFGYCEYESLVRNVAFITAVEAIFREAIVVFLGYSMSDDYVVNLLHTASAATPIFGAGPHFAFVSKSAKSPPPGIQAIRYLAGPNGERKAVLNGIDLLRASIRSAQLITYQSAQDTRQSAQDTRQSAQDIAPKTERAAVSGYYISDILALGTWTTSQSFTAKGPEGKEISASVGQGFVNEEMPPGTTTSLHDIAVGLICFDVIAMSLRSLPALYQLVGGDPALLSLLNAEAVRFVHWQQEPVILFPNANAITGGDICSITLDARSQLTQPAVLPPDGPPSPMSVAQHIRRSLKIIPGREHEANALFDQIEKSTDTFTDSAYGALIPSRVRGALIHPSVRALLGISDAILPTSIPRWLAFPIIRLAHIIEAGAITEAFHFRAAKIAWGAETLATTAFAATTTTDWADDAANYVLTGRFNADLGRFIDNPLDMITVLLRFRDSAAGAALRNEVAGALDANSGPDLVASINAGLKKNIAPEILDNARGHMLGLLVNQAQRPSTAVWGNISTRDQGIALWRRRSAEQFIKYCLANKIGPYDLCPCGSTEKIKFCCANALAISPSRFSK